MLSNEDQLPLGDSASRTASTLVGQTNISFSIKCETFDLNTGQIFVPVNYDQYLNLHQQDVPDTEVYPAFQSCDQNMNIKLCRITNTVDFHADNSHVMVFVI